MRAPAAFPLACVLAALVASASAAAAESSSRAPLPPAYVEECGSCHVAYPARFLGGSSWDNVLAGLADHFGVDASVDAAVLSGLRAYLQSGARSRETTAGRRPLLRITETPWFRHEHPRPGKPIWVHPEVKSAANCGACHREAEAGRYGEQSLRVPRPGGAQ